MTRAFAIFAIAATAVLGARAFDSTAWLEKRAVLTREAERLKEEYPKVAALATAPAEDLVIPLELYDDGSVKTVVTAHRAQYFRDSGLVWAEGVTVKKLREDGEVVSEITASRCLLDRQAKDGWAEGPATVRHDKTVMNGVGVFFSSPESYVKILSEAKIDSVDLKFGEARR